MGRHVAGERSSPWSGSRGEERSDEASDGELEGPEVPRPANRACGTLVLMRPRAWRVLALAIGSAFLWALLVPVLARSAEGQDRAPRDGRRGSGSARAEKTENEREADPDAPDTSDSADVDATSREVNEGGEKVKVIEFSGFDVNGRLKSPQLLYFLNRVRAEFDRPRLPHRSFVPEMERSTQAEGF